MIIQIINKRFDTVKNLNLPRFTKKKFQLKILKNF